MSAPQKLRAGNSELTKLKVLWRDSLADDARAYWQQQFASGEVTQAQIRAEMLAKLKINLRFDKQLTAFRDWEMEQRQLDLEAERQEEDERRALAENPDWTLDQAREAVLAKAYRRAGATGDFKLGLATIKQDLNSKKMGFEGRRIALLEKKAEAYDRAQEILTKAKTSKGGITAETLQQIESELKLL